MSDCYYIPLEHGVDNFLGRRTATFINVDLVALTELLEASGAAQTRVLEM